MSKNYEKLFSELESSELPNGLLGKIMFRIREEKRLSSTRRRLAVFSISAIGSLVAFVPIFQMMQSEISNSGFVQFLSLIFSDFGTVMAYWQNFALTILETLPVLSLIAIFVVVFIFLESIMFISKDIKSVFAPPKLINQSLI